MRVCGVREGVMSVLVNKEVESYPIIPHWLPHGGCPQGTCIHVAELATGTACIMSMDRSIYQICISCILVCANEH